MAVGLPSGIEMTISVKYNEAGESIDGSTPIVILGPNGSGKSRYGLRLAEWNGAESIGALRNIALEQNIPMQALGQANEELRNLKRRRTQRPWQISSEINSLFSKLMAEDSAAAVAFRDTYKDGQQPETTKLMLLQDSWQRLFPGREIGFGGYTPLVKSEHSKDGGAYSAQFMSDGERVARYLAARVLDAAPGLIIVDEPEVHFHSRLAIQFWNELESLRTDCRFAYITHDLNFARSRGASSYLIIRPSTDPQLVSVDAGVPDDIVTDLLAAASFSINARTIVFCEGDESSIDQRVYRAFYCEPETAVVPVGSCRDVIQCAQAFSRPEVIIGMNALGIIDRDYWPQEFLESLPDNVFVLEAQEVESLLCNREISGAIAEHLGLKADAYAEQYDSFLETTAARFTAGLKHKQISERFKRRIEGKLNGALNGLHVADSAEETKESHKGIFDAQLWPASPSDVFDEEAELIECALEAPFEDLLRFLPGKVYLPDLCKVLGMSKVAYVDLVARALEAEVDSNIGVLGQTIRAELSNLLPASQQAASSDPASQGG